MGSWNDNTKVSRRITEAGLYLLEHIDGSESHYYCLKRVPRVTKTIRSLRFLILISREVHM